MRVLSILYASYVNFGDPFLLQNGLFDLAGAVTQRSIAHPDGRQIWQSL
jgi:hypothetical protein